MPAAVTRRAILASALAASAAPRAFAGAPVVVVAIHSDFAHLMVPAIIEDQQVWAGIDNGAETTMVDRAFAGDLDTDSEGRIAIPLGIFPGPRERPVLEVALDSTLQIVAQGVGDLAGASISDELPISAVIGMELFLRRRVEIDFAARTVTLRPTGLPAPGGMNPLPVQPIVHRKHLVDIAVEGQAPVKAVIDLGCSRTVMFNPALAERLGLTAERTPSTNLAHGVDGNDRLDFVTRTGSLRDLTFAGQTFSDVPFEVGDLTYAGEETQALLGLAVLRRFELVFDLASDRIWTSKAARTAEPFSRRVVGLQVETTGAYVRVTHVAAASPAAKAGFVVGDMITEINGAPPKPEALRDAADGQVLALKLADGTLRRLTAARFD